MTLLGGNAHRERHQHPRGPVGWGAPLWHVLRTVSAGILPQPIGPLPFVNHVVAVI